MKKPWPRTLVGDVPAPLESSEVVWSPRLQHGFRCRLARWLFSAAFWVLPEPDLEVTIRASTGS